MIVTKEVASRGRHLVSHANAPNWILGLFYPSSKVFASASRKIKTELWLE